MLKKLACLLALIASPLFAQQTPQAIPLTSGACKLDGTVGCGAGGGGGSGTVNSVAISGGTTGFSFSGSPITTSGTFTLSGTLAIANGGTNLTTYTLGDTLYASAANTLAKLAGNTTTTKKFLMQVGDGVNSAAPTWTATAADFPTLNQSTTGNAATATALASNPTDCSAGQYANAIAANGNLTCGAVAYSEVTGTPTAGANTALSNLASVAINTTLATGAGTAAQLTATPPAAITTAQAGVAAGITASGAVAGSSVAGAAAGGSITFTGGAAARLTSGNADGGGFTFTGGAGVGTGKRGTPSAPGAGGAGSEAWGAGAVASSTPSAVFGTNASATAANTAVFGNGASTAFSSGTALGNSATAGGIASVAVGASAATSVGDSIALGFSASATLGNAFVVGAASGVNGRISDQYLGGITATDKAGSSINYRTVGGSGTDTGGASLVLLPGPGTGTSASGDLYVKTGVPRATGSTAQSPTVRYSVRAKQTTLTESTATAVVTIPVATGKVVGGMILYTISANNGTDFQSTSGSCTFSGVNKAGTVTGSTPTCTAETTATSTASTLTSTWTVVANGTNIDLKCNAVSSLTQTTLEVHSQLMLNGDDLTGTVTWN